MSQMDFNDIGIHRPVIEGLHDLGITTPTALQQAVIPGLLAGKDIVAEARRGSGKTMAYGAPIIGTLKKSDTTLTAIILAPDRELILKVHHELERLSQYVPMRLLSAPEEQAVESQAIALTKGVNILISTPARLMDLIRMDRIQLKHLRFLVLDEADKMIMRRQKNNLEEIFLSCPEDTQTLIFSSTLPDELHQLVHHYLHRDPQHVFVPLHSTQVKPRIRKKYRIDKLAHTDLNLYKCGFEECAPNHSWGPAIRDHFLIHYITHGQGVFKTQESTYRLNAGQGFLLCPNQIASYQADDRDPWSYYWVGFHGLKAEDYLQQAGLGDSQPVFSWNGDNHQLVDTFEQILSANELYRGRDIRLVGYLYVLLSEFVAKQPGTVFSDQNQEKDPKESYVEQALSFMHKNYSQKISVSEIAVHVGLNRSYLYNLFRTYLQTSPQDYLVRYRIEKACNLLESSTYSIGEISRSVGYDDPLLFSKMFKKIRGVSPREYRKNHH